MRILTLHFKNINSLEGENRLDFQEPPFSDTGVFAITGPNGSGKSSILDAITLGLYGETFRFDRPAAHVMTRQTAESFAEVDFVVKQQLYRSSWMVQRENGDPSGALLPVKMQLQRLTPAAEVLATNPQQVCQQIMEITGMNFRNFTRSILLAQGDFAAFLNALDNERMDILEKIISSDIYSDYKQQVFDRAEQAQQRLNELHQDLAVVQIMDPLQREAYEHDLLDFNDRRFELQQEQEKLKQQQSALDTVTLLQERLLAQNNRLESSKAELQEHHALIDKIVLAHDAVPFKADIELLQDKNAALQQYRQDLVSIQDEIGQLQQLVGNQLPPADFNRLSITEQRESIDTIRAQVGLLTSQRNSEISLLQALAIQIDEKRGQLASVTAWLDSHPQEAALVEDFPALGRLRQLRAEVAELEQQHGAAAKWVKTTLAGLDNSKDALAKERKQLVDLRQDLQIKEEQLVNLAQGRSLAQIEELMAELKERTDAFEKLHNLALASQKLDKSKVGFFGRLFGRKPVTGPSALELKAQIAELTLDLKREENIKLALESLAFQESLVKKLAGDRVRLIDDKPCPLCGSLDHPYARMTPMPGNSKQALVDQQLKLKKFQAALDRLNKELLLAQKQEQKNNSEQNQLILIRSEWLTLSNQLAAARPELDISNFSLMKQLWDEQAAELKEAVSLFNKYKTTQVSIEKLKVAITQSEALIEKLQQTVQALEAEWQQRPQDVNYEAQLSAKAQEEQQLTQKIISQLATLGEKMPSKKKEEALLDRLNARRQEYQSYALRRKGLVEELDELTAKELHSQNEIKYCNDKLDNIAPQLQNAELAGLHLALVEKQNLRAGREQLIAQQQSENQQLQLALQNRLLGSPFSSVNEIMELLALLPQQATLVQRQAELTDEVAFHTQELQNLTQQLQAEKQQLPPGIVSHDLTVQQKRLQEQLEIATLEAQRLERLLKDQQQLQLKYDAALLLVEQQRELVRQAQAEADRIKAESGIEFRRRVQTQMADRLLSQTNAILEKISGRYYLRRTQSEQGLALEVEDTLQNNVRRLPKSLSGGESFLVSLALALGLAELANNGSSVDSLFLDEGFGNLDADTLYTVISTLENLHTQQGKTVGVISHVESVQKRFKAQLQVVKKPNGRGELKKAS